jgi:hypothetical protein
MGRVSMEAFKLIVSTTVRHLRRFAVTIFYEPMEQSLDSQPGCGDGRQLGLPVNDN